MGTNIITIDKVLKEVKNERHCVSMSSLVSVSRKTAAGETPQTYAVWRAKLKTDELLKSDVKARFGAALAQVLFWSTKEEPSKYYPSFTGTVRPAVDVEPQRLELFNTEKRATPFVVFEGARVLKVEFSRGETGGVHALVTFEFHNDAKAQALTQLQTSEHFWAATQPAQKHFDFAWNTDASSDDEEAERE